MNSSDSKKLAGIGVFQISDAKKIGVSKLKLARLVEDEVVIRLAPGFYVHNNSKLDPDEYDFALACKKFGPKSLIGGLSALYHYRLISNVPDRVWVIVPPHIRTTQTLFCLIRSLHNLNVGVLEYNFYRISTIERTIVESLSYANKIGLSTALSAARLALKENLTTTPKLYNLAKNMSLLSTLEKYWESIIAE